MTVLPNPAIPTPDKIRQQFAAGIRWPEGANMGRPMIVTVCKKCAALWISEDTYKMWDFIVQHVTMYGCQGAMLGNELGSELEKILRALEIAE